MHVESKEAVLRLLHLALVDIRASVTEGRSGPAFGLADLLHVAPLELLRVEREGGDPLEVLTSIWQRAQQQGVQDWVRNALQHQVQLSPATLAKLMSTSS